MSVVEAQQAPTAKYRQPAPNERLAMANGAESAKPPIVIAQPARIIPVIPAMTRPRVIPCLAANRSVTHPPKGQLIRMAQKGVDAYQPPRRMSNPLTLTRYK